MPPLTALQALHLFKSHDEPHRRWMESPVLIDDYALATNGHWLVQIDRVLVGHLSPSEPPPVRVKPLDLLQRGWRPFGPDATPMAAMALPDAERCKACDGAGQYGYSSCACCEGAGWFERDGHDYTCKSCDGEGLVADYTAAPAPCRYCEGHGIEISYGQGGGVDVASNHFTLHYLQMLKSIPGCWFDPGRGGGVDGGQMGLFTFPLEGGYMARGALMPRRR